jgi:hypothetical protein
VPFLSDHDVAAALEDAGVTGASADAIVSENQKARLSALRAALAVVAVVAGPALFLSGSIPTRQPGSGAAPETVVDLPGASPAA